MPNLATDPDDVTRDDLVFRYAREHGGEQQLTQADRRRAERSVRGLPCYSTGHRVPAW
jgi:hypothetical protein